ncbi:hypothetical protein BBP40_001582 [Aspergillus hancockii]|nr:hypothetical protein BBP40_001582 [Aspergillus hancockii]
MPITQSDFETKSICLTDARRVGVMLRDRRLTLRNHAAFSTFTVEFVNSTDFVLRSEDFDPREQNVYIRIGGKGTLRTEVSRNQAQTFQMEQTALGLELYMNGQRLSVYDEYFDVSIGQWQNGRSRIAILVHSADPAGVWE